MQLAVDTGQFEGAALADLAIHVAPVCLYLNGANADFVDGIHPDEAGQQKLQAAFQTGFVALNGTGGLVAQVR